MFPVWTELITSTDESTQYIFEGNKAHQDKFSLVTKESNAMRGTKTVYKLDCGKNMCGMRVNLLDFSMAQDYVLPYLSLFLDSMTRNHPR